MPAGVIDVDEARRAAPPPVTSTYAPRDLILYALSVGSSEPRFVYEGGADFRALPTFAVVPALNALTSLAHAGMPGLRYGLDRILHAEQRLTLARPVPLAGELRH